MELQGKIRRKVSSQMESPHLGGNIATTCTEGSGPKGIKNPIQSKVRKQIIAQRKGVNQVTAKHVR